MIAAAVASPLGGAADAVAPDAMDYFSARPVASDGDHDAHPRPLPQHFVVKLDCDTLREVGGRPCALIGQRITG